MMPCGPSIRRLLTAGLAWGLWIGGITSDLRAETREELLKAFSPEHAIELDHPFVGDLKIIYYTQTMGSEWVEPLRLSALSPPDDPHIAPNAQSSPYLSTLLRSKGTGISYALRAEWPGAKELAALTQAKNYAALVKAFGQPTHIGNRSAFVEMGQGKGLGLYQRIWWKLFRPIDADTIEVFDLTVDRVRKTQQWQGKPEPEHEEDIIISGLQIRLGTLKREK